MRRWLRRYLTAGGHALFAIALISLLAGVDPFNTQLYGLFVTCTALGVAALFTGVFFQRRLDGDWKIPVRAVAGGRFKARVRLENRSRRPAYEIEAAFDHIPPGLWQRVEEPGENRQDRLLAGESAEIELTLWAERRGAYTLGPIYAGVTFPFGIARWPTRLGGRRRLLVTPPVHPIQTLQLHPGLRYQPGGVPLASRTGESLEFVGVREYRQGDSLRKIHWKLWARRGEPVVREYSQEYFSRVGVILDSYRPPGRQQFEAATEVAASVAGFLAAQDAIVDFFAAGAEVYFLSAGRHLSPLQSILDVLACVEPCNKPPYARLEQQLLDMLARLSAVVVITFAPNAERRRFLERLRLGGAPLRIFCVGRAQPLDTLGELATEAAWIDPEEMPRCLLHL